ncbi:FAD-dependent oxidoreductase [Sphingomonas sp. ASV193]|uniref:FAD-dependent oxidoreductase n=1 Tax=Sphingomonas sp. ASV193 TaxID=3144405 RepID=UPI0032E8B9F4
MESIGVDLSQLSPKPFEGEQLAAIEAIGREVDYPAGAMVLDVGEPLDRFIYLRAGEIEVVNPYTGDRLLPGTLKPGQFAGELNFLNGGSATLGMRAAAATRTLEVPRDAMLQLMADVPELSDHILTVFSARRRMQVAQGRSAITLLGADRDPAVQRVASFLSRNRIPFQSFDLDAQGEDMAHLCRVADDGPAVIFNKGQKIDEPTPRKVAGLLGLDLDSGEHPGLDLLIVGGGPAGVAAAVYAGSEGLKALVIEDAAIGGQAGTSSRIENYMGFPTGISGADLVYRGQIQAMKFGTRFAMPRRVERLERNDGGFCATLDGGQQLCARAVLVATGVQYRRLPIERIEEYEGTGVYYAATEMEARFCRETDAVVIGGGNSAGQAAMYLSRAARHVHLLVRSDSLAATMSSYLRERLEAEPRISIHYHSRLTGLDGGEHLERVAIDERGKRREIDCRALFVMIGAAPNTDWLCELVDLDDKGFVRTGRDAGGRSGYETSCPGIFAVGDVRSGSVKRVASSVGEGSVVVSSIWTHVEAAKDAAEQAGAAPAG